MSNNERLPRWSKWRRMPEVEIWKAVSLSLNIEPEKSKTKTNNECMAYGYAHPFDEGEEFNDRLSVLEEHSCDRAYFPTEPTKKPWLNKKHLPEFASWNLADAEWLNRVRLDEFASWALTVAQWVIPDELKSIAANATPQAAPVPKIEAATSTTTPCDNIPGKMPKITIGKLAIKAAWEIECQTCKRATAQQVIEKLQQWEPNEPVITEKIAYGVAWITTKGKTNNYDIQTCAKALETWNKSRA